MTLFGSGLYKALPSATRTVDLIGEKTLHALFLLRAVHRDRLRKFRFGIGKVEQICNLAIGAALLASRPLLSPLAWPLAYAWPVHRIGPDFLPEGPPDAPTLLLLHRGADGRVRFHAPNPLAWRLLRTPGLRGWSLLLALLTLAQVILGVLNVKLSLPLHVAVMHNGGAALLLFVLVSLLARLRRAT